MGAKPTDSIAGNSGPRGGAEFGIGILGIGILGIGIPGIGFLGIGIPGIGIPGIGCGLARGAHRDAPRRALVVDGERGGYG